MLGSPCNSASKAQDRKRSGREEPRCEPLTKVFVLIIKKRFLAAVHKVNRDGRASPDNDELVPSRHLLNSPHIKKMGRLPQDIIDLILDYKYGLEHAIKFRACLIELYFWGILRRPHWLNLTAVAYWLPF